MVKSHIALGSNIGDSKQNVQQAIEAIAYENKICARSSLYLTKPWGYLDQPDFINAAITIETQLEPYPLLKFLQKIEQDMGREREIHWGPRTIDLDILTYADLAMDEPNLKIPHPLMMERAFVLAPLSEIDAHYLEAYSKLTSEQRNEVQRL